MLDVVDAAAALVLWTVVLWRVGNARRRGAERSLWFVLAMFACAITVELPGPRHLVDAALAPFAAAAWLWTCCAVLAAVGARSLVVHLQVGQAELRRDRRHVVLGVVGLAAVTLSYVLAPPPLQLAASTAPALVQRAPFYAGSVQSAVRWAVWLSLLTWALAGMAQVTAQYAAHAAQAIPGRLTTGLRLGALGCRVGYGYVALKSVVVAAWAAGQGPRFLLVDELADTVALLSIALITAGSTYDAVTAWLRSCERHAERVRAQRRLRRLSTLLRRTLPDGSATIFALGPRGRLSRRVVGIRDRQLTLRPYVGPEVPRRALEAAQEAGYQGEDARAAAEAAWLEAARLAKARGLAPVVDVVYDTTYEARGGADLDEEAQWLVRVAEAHSSPLTRDFAAHQLARDAVDPGRRRLDEGHEAA